MAGSQGLARSRPRLFLVRPPQQRNFSLDKDKRPMVKIDEIFLPGHCLELKFHKQPQAASS